MGSIKKVTTKGKKKSETARSGFKWTNGLKISMASYLNEHFNTYKVSESGNKYNKKNKSTYYYDDSDITYQFQTSGEKNGKKAQFLRQMKDDLGIDCNETQFRNGFNSIIRKYMEIRKQLNSSGFGVDPEKDATLDKGSK